MLPLALVPLAGSWVPLVEPVAPLPVALAAVAGLRQPTTVVGCPDPLWSAGRLVLDDGVDCPATVTIPATANAPHVAANIWYRFIENPPWNNPSC
jgi:hypothetical protein